MIGGFCDPPILPMDKLKYSELASPGLPARLAGIVDSDWFQHSITAVIIANAAVIVSFDKD